MRRVLSPPVALSLLFAVSTIATGCTDVTIARPPEREGDDPGECSDGADNDGNGLYDCDDVACSGAPECIDNLPPTAPEASVSPASPRTTDTLACTVSAASTDPEGDTISYRYTWTRNGEDSGIETSNVSPGATARGDVWMCTIIPEDDFGVGPSGSASVTVGNTPPSGPGIGIEPSSPVVTDDLECEVAVESEDPDGDTVGYSYRWVRNSNATGFTGTEVPAIETESGDLWTCIVTPNDGLVDGPDGEAFVEVHVDIVPHVRSSRHHTCSVNFDGTWNCWGDNSSGQLNGTGGSYWKLAVGEAFTCGILFGTTELECWGDNTFDQVIAPLGTWIDAAAGRQHSCGIFSNGSLAVWGNAINWTTSPPGGAFVQVTAGEEFCCSRFDYGDVTCWGDQNPGDPDLIEGYQSIDAGRDHVCGIRDDETVYCWGDDSYGQVSGAPVGGQWTNVTAGRRHSCAVRSETGFVTCWGSDENGQASPEPGVFDQIDAGWYHTCGVRPNNTIDCWGCEGQDVGQCSPP